MKVEVVVPHHLKNFDFLEEWKSEFLWNELHEVHIIVVEDKSVHEAKLPDWVNGGNFEWYDHTEIQEELRKDSWIIPQGTSACRSFGLYKAWQRKPDMIVTLDNDCFPNSDRTEDGTPSQYYIEGHWDALCQPATLDWVKPTEGWLGLHTRGFPYLIRDKSKTYVNHGLWSNIPDLDAASMLFHPDLRTKPVSPAYSKVIPRWNFYPMCGMNLAFRPEVTPLMYFGLFGEKYGFDQFDDIWAGVFSKKVMDHLGWAVRSGYPSVEHRKQSNAFVNFKKQAGGMQYNEDLWRQVQKVDLTEDNPVDAYKELLDKLHFSDAYFKKVKKATYTWLELFV